MLEQAWVRRGVAAWLLIAVGVGCAEPASAAQPLPKPPETAVADRLEAAGLVTALTGLLTIGMGGLFGIAALDIASRVQTQSAFDAELYDRGQAAERNSFILYGAGAAGLVLGGALYWLGRRGLVESGQALQLGVGVSRSVTPGPSRSPEKWLVVRGSW